MIKMSFCLILTVLSLDFMSQSFMGHSQENWAQITKLTIFNPNKVSQLFQSPKTEPEVITFPLGLTELCQSQTLSVQLESNTLEITKY